MISSMFERSRTITLSLSLALAASALLVGCEAAGPKRIDTTTASMQATREMLVRGGGDVDRVMSSARAIGSAPDLKKSYADFSKSVDALEKVAADVRSRWAGLTSRADAYRTAWERESANLTSEAAKATAAERRASFDGVMRGVTLSMGDLKDSYDVFIADIQDIRLLLGNDLTADGIRAVQPLITSAGGSASTVQSKLNEAIRLLDAAAASSATKLPTNG
jgi:hypothetical protein